MLSLHHGSRTSSSAAFLEAVSPRWAVVQAGYRNRFGHPVPEVMARLRQRGVQVETSDVCGAWGWGGEGVADGLPPGGRCERERVRRYWHHQVQRGE